MIFLIEYNRRQGRLVTFRQFADSDLETAERERLELELNRDRTSDTPAEVVLLQADSETALRSTHRRYFQTPREIIESSTGTRS